MLGDAIAQAVMGLVIVCVVVTAIVTTALIFAIPWLWALLKPWIHMVTG